MAKVSITFSLTDKEAEAFAEFLKRVSFGDYRNNATSDDEAYSMQSAGGEIREVLTKKGFEPR